MAVAKVSGWDFSYTTSSCEFADVARLRGDFPSLSAASAEAAQLRRISRKMAGTENGIAAPISTTGRRLGPQRMRNVKSIPFRKVGPCYRGPEIATRSRLAMEAVYKRLVRQDDALIQLLDPPFDKSELNPGYIKGYVPGVEREWRAVHAWSALDRHGLRRPG